MDQAQWGNAALKVREAGLFGGESEITAPVAPVDLLSDKTGVSRYEYA